MLSRCALVPASQGCTATEFDSLRGTCIAYMNDTDWIKDDRLNYGRTFAYQIPTTAMQGHSVEHRGGVKDICIALSVAYTPYE